MYFFTDAQVKLNKCIRAKHGRFCRPAVLRLFTDPLYNVNIIGN